MIASLAMYDWPEVAASNDALWALIHENLTEAGIAAPATLDRGTDPWAVWLDPALVLAQTCGMPFRTRLHGSVALIGTPDYGLQDTAPGYYYSQIIVRRDDPRPLAAFRDGVLAYNDDHSQSGWAAPQNHAAGLGFRFTNTLRTGAHRLSAEAVADGRADLAAIDAVTWRLIQRRRPETAELLRIVARTPPTPGLPLITARTQDPQLIATAVESAITRLPQEHIDALGLTGLIRIPALAYLAVPNPLTVSSNGG